MGFRLVYSPTTPRSQVAITDQHLPLPFQKPQFNNGARKNG